MRLFNRKYRLRVGSLEWADPLQIEFSVELFASRSSGKATITIYNLSKTSAGAIEQASSLELYAGYEQIQGKIFSGSIRPRAVRVERDRVIIESLAQPDDLLSGTVVIGVIGQVSNRNIISQLASAAGLVYAEQSKTTQVTYGGWAWSGSIRSALDDLVDDIDATWWVQGSALYVLPRGVTLTASVVELNSNTGLIGTPARGNGLIEATSLLNPLILPGTRVRLQSDAATGDYRVQGATFTGGYQGGDWQVVARLKTLEAG